MAQELGKGRSGGVSEGPVRYTPYESFVLQNKWHHDMALQDL